MHVVGIRSVCAAFNNDGSLLASVGPEGWEVWRYDPHDPELLAEGGGDAGYVDVSWSRGGLLALGCSDGTVEIVDSADAERRQLLEGHTRDVTSVSFSSDGRLLASKSLDGTVRLWDCETWEAVSLLREPGRGQSPHAGMAFAPDGLSLATLGPGGRVVRVWELDPVTLATRRDIAPTTHYANAKVVLLGDSGVGKTGLGLVLAGQLFRATESSHGRSIWLLDAEESDQGPSAERRETYLWDLAGQPGYRLLHQLYLSDVVLALIVFDARGETDSFAGVRHWTKALSQVARVRDIPKLLIAARIDRGGPVVSTERITEVISAYGFARYLETSAKTGHNVPELYEEIRRRIDWERMPRVSSTGLFDSIKSFLTAQRSRETLLMTVDDLLRAYVQTQDDVSDPELLRSEFETCVGRVAAGGLIRRLSFGGLVLLRPETLDAYAAALVNAARDQPDATGAISEDLVRQGEFEIPDDDRLRDRDLERLLLAATLEEVLRHEVALREHSDEGPYLVFPTQARMEALSLAEPDQVWLTIVFEGPVQNVYATLVVRIAHSGLFTREASFRNATTFRRLGMVLGIAVNELPKAKGDFVYSRKGPSTAMLNNCLPTMCMRM